MDLPKVGDEPPATATRTMLCKFDGICRLALDAVVMEEDSQTMGGGIYTVSGIAGSSLKQ